MERLFIATVFVFAQANMEQSKPPDRAREPFVIFVYASPKGEEGVVASIFEARTELEKALQKNEKWFRVDESKEEAELVVDLLAYSVRVVHKNFSRSRWYLGGGNTMHADRFEEQHSLFAITTVFGTARDMKGVQVKQGGSVKGAARDLAKQLERYVKENYWELENRRVARR